MNFLFNLVCVAFIVAHWMDIMYQWALLRPLLTKRGRRVE